MHSDMGVARGCGPSAFINKKGHWDLECDTAVEDIHGSFIMYTMNVP